MFNWLKDMRRKQRESDRLLEVEVRDKRMQLKDKRMQLKSSAMSLIVSCKNTIKDTTSKYKITQEDLDVFVGEGES